MAPLGTLIIIPLKPHSFHPQIHSKSKTQNCSCPMAPSTSSSSCSFSSVRPLPDAPIAFAGPIFTEDQFRAFHNIDRILFTRLVQGLGRDSAESLQVMALLLFMERSGISEASAVYKIVPLPDTIVHAVADEAVLCLQCIDTDIFLFAPEEVDVPLICSLCDRSSLSLKHFFDNRMAYVRGVTRVVNEVCSRAFDDLVRLAAAQKQRGGGGGAESSGAREKKPLAQPQQQVVFNYNYLPPTPPMMGGLPFLNVNAPPYMPGIGQDMAGFRAPVDPYDFELQRRFLNRDMSEIMSQILMPEGLGIGGGSGGGDRYVEERLSGRPVAAVDGNGRTLFLTFSKGYHVTEKEVRDFFSRRFPDVYVEAIIMQEVCEDAQPLFAKLVVGCPEDIVRILNGVPKAKFNINGKHVWARKYVHKLPTKPSDNPNPNPNSNPPSSPAY